MSFTIPLVPPVAGYTPRETFSPSALALAARCKAAWGFRYIEGWRERELSWEQIQAGVPHMPRERGKALGKAVHFKMEVYYWPLVWHAPLVWYGEVDWTDEPGQRALAMLEHLPRLEEIIECEVEQPIEIDVAKIRSCAEPPVFNGFRDLTVRLYPSAVKRLKLPQSPENRYTFDYKSTSDWKWQKPADTLLEDEQGVLYPLHTIHAHNVDTHVCVWVYSHTKLATPQARTTVFVQTRSNAERLAEKLVVFAIDLRADMRSGIHANELPKNTAECGAFGGCPYHPSSNGPCQPGQRSLGAELLALEQAEKGNAHMSKFGAVLAAAGVTTQPAATTETPPAATEAAPAEQPAAASEPAPATATEPAASAQPTSAQTAARKAKGATRAPSNGEIAEFRYSLPGVIGDARMPADLAATLAERLRDVGLL